MARDVIISRPIGLKALLIKRKQLWFLSFLRGGQTAAGASVRLRCMHLGKGQDDLANQLALGRGQLQESVKGFALQIAHAFVPAWRCCVTGTSRVVKRGLRLSLEDGFLLSDAN